MNKKITKKYRLIFSIFMFNSSLLTPFLLTTCSKNSNDVSFVIDLKTGKKYFFTDLTKTNICGLSGNITIEDQQWERSKFNLPIFLSSKIQKIDDNFLYGCSAFNHEIVIPDSCYEIGANFLYNCEKFDSNLILSPNIKNIGNNFMYMCSMFSGKGKININNLKNLIKIGDNFMYKCENFDDNDIICTSNKLLCIGKSFLSKCYKFNSNISFHTPILSEIGDGFLSYCYNLNHPIDFLECDALKLIPSRFLYHCEKFNSNLKFPKYLERIGPSVMVGCREYNYDNFSSQKLPKTLKRINSDFLSGCEKYNHDFVVPFNTKIDKGFLHNCYSMESTVDIGLNNFDDTLENDGSLTCEIPKMKNLSILNNLKESKELLSFFKIVEMNKDYFNNFKFITDNNSKSNDISDIFSVLKWFSDGSIEEIITRADGINFKNANDFINLLIYSWKLKQILDYSFKKDEFNDIFGTFNSEETEQLKKIHSELISFCTNYKYFLSGIKLKTLDNKTSYDRNIEKINNETWRYTDQQNPLLHEADNISDVIDHLFGYANFFYKNLSIKKINDDDKKTWKPSSELSELKLVNWLYELVANSVVNDEILKDDELKNLIITKILDLNVGEMEIFSLYLNYFIPYYFLDKKKCEKFKNNFNEILNENPRIKEKLKTDFDYSLLPTIQDRFVVFVNYLNLIIELVQKDGKDKYYQYVYNSINKLKEIIGEKDQILINKLLDGNNPNIAIDQLLTYLSLGSLVIKQNLIEKLIDENFTFDYTQNNIIKKLNGDENINLSDFDKNILGQIKNQLLIDILYYFSDIDYDNKSCLEDFIKQLFEEKFIKNWFEKIIEKKAEMSEFFSVDKLFTFFKEEYWNEKVNKLDVDDYNHKIIWDNYKTLLSKFVGVLHEKFSLDNITSVAKKTIKKNFLSLLIRKINDFAKNKINDLTNKVEFKDEFINDLKNTFNSFNSNRLGYGFIENKDELKIIKEDFENYAWAIFMFDTNLDWEKLVQKINDQEWKNQNIEKLKKLSNALQVDQEKLSGIINSFNEQTKNRINELIMLQKNALDSFNDNYKQIQVKLQQTKEDFENYAWAIFMFDTNLDWEKLVQKINDQEWKNQNIEKLKKLSNALQVDQEKLSGIINSFNEQTKNRINELIRAQKLSIDVYGNCEFLFENNYLNKNMSNITYINKLLYMINNCKFVDMSNLLPLYLHLVNIDYNLWIDKKIKIKNEIEDFFISEVVNKFRKEFCDKLKEELDQFYDDEYDDYNKKFVLKNLYDAFIDELFIVKEGGTLDDISWFKTLFSLGQNDKKLRNFVDAFVNAKSGKKLQDLKKYGDSYCNFKCEIILVFKKVLADILNKTNNSFFMDISNNIFLEDSFALKMCMLIFKIYDEKILNMKNNKNFCHDIYSVVSDNILSEEYAQFVFKKETNNFDYLKNIIKEIKLHKNSNWFNFETIIKYTDDALNFFNNCKDEIFLENIKNIDHNFFVLLNKMEQSSNIDESISKQIEFYKKKIKKITMEIKELELDDDIPESKIWNLEIQKRNLIDNMKALGQSILYDTNLIRKELEPISVNENLLLFIKTYCSDVKNIFNFIFKYDSELWDMKPALDFGYEVIYDIDGENPQMGYYIGMDGSDNDGILLKNLFNFIMNNLDDSIIEQANLILLDIDNLNNYETTDIYDKNSKYLDILINFVNLFNLFSKANIMCEHNDKYISAKFPEIKTFIDVLMYIKKILVRNNENYQKQLLKNGNIFDAYFVYKNLNQNFKNHLLLRNIKSKEMDKLENENNENLPYINKSSVDIFIEKCKMTAKKNKGGSENRKKIISIFDEYVNLIDASGSDENN